MNPSSVDFSDRRIALALSGGGVRAAAFHLGVLRFLAGHQLMEKVTYISTVSGGSLLAGMVFSQNDYRWPTSQEFQERVHPSISHLMQRYDLQWSYIGRLFLLPWNWLRFAYRANVLADAIRATWKIRAPLSKLPPKPVWAINGTTMETGRRWRFRAESPTGDAALFAMGDGELGETDASSFPLASAMATSAAFPGASVRCGFQPAAATGLPGAIPARVSEPRNRFDRCIRRTTLLTAGYTTTWDLSHCLMFPRAKFVRAQTPTSSSCPMRGLRCADVRGDLSPSGSDSPRARWTS